MVTKLLFGGKSSKIFNNESHKEDLVMDPNATIVDKQIELAHALYQKGRKLWTKGNKEEALALLRKAVAMQEHLLGGRHSRTAKTYYFLGQTLKHMKEYEKALNAYRRSLRSRLWNEEILEDVQRSMKELLVNKFDKAEGDVQQYFETAAVSVQLEKDAETLMENGEYDKAVESFEKCLSIENDADGNSFMDIGHLLLQIGDAQRQNKEFEMSLNAYRDALSVYEATLGKDHSKTMRCLEGIKSCALGKDITDDVVQKYLRTVFLSLEHCRKGDTFVESKDYQKAVEEFEAARIIEEAALGKYPLTAAGIRKKLALAFEAMEEHDRAIFELRMVLSISIFDCGGGHPSVTAALKDIGAAMKAKGIDQESIYRYINTVSFSVKHQRYGEHLLGDKEDFSTAIEELQKSLALEVAPLGKYHLTQGALFKGIGDAFLAQENFDFAVVNYRNALLVYQPVLGQHHIDTNLTLFMIGSAAAQSVGLDGNAVDKYRENVSESIVLEKLAEMLANKGSKEEAIETYEKAVALEEASLVEYHLSTADLHGKIAKEMKCAEQYDRAIVKYRSILSIYLRSLGADHPNTQNAHEELVEAVAARGLGKEQAKGYGLKVLVSIEHEARGDEDLDCERYSQGMAEFRKALEIEESALGDGHLVTAALYGKLAHGFRYLGRTTDAIEEYRKAIRIYVTHKAPDRDAFTLLRGLGKCIQGLGFNEEKGVQYQKIVWDSVKSEQLGDDAMKSGDSSEAIYHYQRSISLEESVLGKLHASTCASYEKIARIFSDAGDIESAVIVYSKVLAIRESHLGKDDVKTIDSYNDLIDATAKQMTATKAPMEEEDDDTGVEAKMKIGSPLDSFQSEIGEKTTAPDEGPTLSQTPAPISSEKSEHPATPKSPPDDVASEIKILSFAERMKAFQR
jgi:tetratricopeptide (TPR) repeat protein